MLKVPLISKEDSTWLRALSHADGLNPLHLMTVAEAKLWPKIGYAASLATPDPRKLVCEWARVQRRCLNTYDDCHTVIVTREWGISHNPVWFVLKSIHALCQAAKKDTQMHALLQYSIQHDHPLAKRLNRFLRVADITIQDILHGMPLPVIRMRFTTWANSNIRTEALRLGLWQEGDPLWEINHSAATYLGRPLAKYGTLFRLPHFGIPHAITAACYFCQAPAEDTGTHLVLHCPRVPIARPNTLARMWPLSNVPHHATELDNALHWMSRVWRTRRERREQLGRPRYHPSYTPPDTSRFFNVDPHRPRVRPRPEQTDEPQPPTQRRRIAATRPPPIETALPLPQTPPPTPTQFPPLSPLTPPPIQLGTGTLITTLPQTPPAHHTTATHTGERRRQVRWTPEEDDALIREITVNHQTSPTGIQPALPHRSPHQIRKRIHTKTIQRRLLAILQQT